MVLAFIKLLIIVSNFLPSTSFRVLITLKLLLLFIYYTEMLFGAFMPFQISFDEFRKIVCRCNMLKGSDDGVTGKLGTEDSCTLVMT